MIRKYVSQCIRLKFRLLFAIFCCSAAFSIASAQDHIDQPVGPPPQLTAFQGKLEPLNIYSIPANPEKGFHWPYYLATPKTVNKKAILFVEPNNDGKSGAPFETHEYWASIRCEQARIDFTSKLGTFALVPVFPRPQLANGNNLYIHALTRPVVEQTEARFKRIDLQLLAMIVDAQSKIRDNGHQIADKFMLWGFSAAGDFVTRMALIHPEKVQCVVAGGLGGFPILPLEKLDNTSLTYPVGIADFEQLFNKAFNADAFKSIPIKLFQGGADENDSVAGPDELKSPEEYLSDSYSYDQSEWINNRFGEKPVGRVQDVTAIYKNFGMQNFHYVIVPGIDHITAPFKDEVLKFLEENAVIE